MTETSEQKIIRSVLKKNNISGNLEIKKYSSGQINSTYSVGNDLVIKIQKDLDVLHHQPEIIKFCVAKGAKVPQVIDCGIENGKEYLLTTKLSGRKLAEDWHRFSAKQKESFIAQTAEQLKLFHSIGFASYSLIRPREFADFKSAMRSFVDFDVLQGKEFDEITENNLQLIKDYYQKNENLLTETGTAVLVHNDLHFENILYEGDNLTGIIDFDFARQAPKDYELWHLIDFFHTPFYFVEEKLEPIWKKYELKTDLKLFKKYYPELFADDRLFDRLRLYFIDDIISHAEGGYSDRVNDQIETYFKSDWLEKNL